MNDNRAITPAAPCSICAILGGDWHQVTAGECRCDYFQPGSCIARHEPDCLVGVLARLEHAMVFYPNDPEGEPTVQFCSDPTSHSHVSVDPARFGSLAP